MILYQGLLDSPASWARVGRGYLKELVRQGIRVGAVAPRGFRYDPEFPVTPGIERFRSHEVSGLRAVRVGLGFLHPPLLGRLVGERKLNCFVWEASRVPHAWVEALRLGVDLVLVPSEFTRRALVDSGLPPPACRVVPYGYDREALEALEAREAAGAAARRLRTSRFTFLAVLAPHYRKGVTELLKAYRLAFTSSDEVILRIKSTYDPGRERRRAPFEISSWSEALEAAACCRPGAPRVELDLRCLSDAATLALYRDADAVVQPSWGEAFGLAVLEALAVGVPVLTTAWSGPLDFLPPGPDRLPFRLTRAATELYEPADGALVARPDVEALAARMRWHYEHPEESRRIGAANRLHAAPWTWAAATRRLLEVIGELTGES